MDQQLNQEHGPSVYHTFIGDINYAHTSHKISGIRVNSNLKVKDIQEYTEFMIKFINKYSCI